MEAVFHSSRPSPRFVEFQSFRLDRWNKIVVRNGVKVPLTPKSYDLLELLVTHAGEVVSHETLLSEVWPGVHIEENTIHRHVAMLRQALGDNNGQGKFIETHPRRGYRFVAPVTTARKSFRWTTGVGVALLIMSCGLVVFSTRPRPSASTQGRSVTVLPFRLFNHNSDQRYLASVISDSLANRLGSVRGVTVRPPSRDVMGSDPRTAAERLGVNEVITGDVQTFGDTIRISAQLFDVERGANVWSRQLDGKSADVLDLEDVIAEDIGNRLKPGLSAEERQRLTPPHSRDAMANDEYLRGRDLLDRRTALDESISHFRRSVTRDPQFALAWAGLAEALAHPQSGHDVESVRQATEAAERAIGLDPQLAEAHATLGFIGLFYQWSWSAADRELRVALQLNPGSARTHDWYAIALVTRGRFASAGAEINAARSIDPLSVDIANDAALVYYLSRNLAGAERAARAAVSIDPSAADSRSYLTMVLTAQGRIREARAELASAPRGDFLIPLRDALLRHRAGDASVRAWIDEHLTDSSFTARIPPETVAGAYAQLGEYEKALDWLEHACDQRTFGMIFASVDPQFEPLRGNPRFAALKQRIGLLEGASPRLE